MKMSEEVVLKESNRRFKDKPWNHVVFFYQNQVFVLCAKMVQSESLKNVTNL